MATILLISLLVIDNVSLKEYGTINYCPAMRSIFSFLNHSIMELRAILL